MLSIQTDVNSLTIQQNLNTNNAGMQTAVARLSSGFRINSAADDSAGYAIASQLSSENAALQAGSNNALQATAMVNIANAAASQIQNMLVRLQTLATEAASGNNSGSALTNLQAEATKLITNINTIANGTDYNGVKLLTGTTGNVTIQVGPNSTDRVSVAFGNNYTAGSAGLGLTGSISSQTGAQAFMTQVSTALSTLTTNAADLGATVNQLGYVNSYLSSANTQMSAAVSTIKDANMAQEMANYTKSQILVQAGTSLLAQTKQNEMNVLALFK